jgi:site-specific recombinase XerD
MSNVIDQFIQEYGTYNGISADRLSEQRVVLTNFATVVQGGIETATAKDFEQWMLDKMNAGLQPSTVTKYGNMLRPFFKWAWRKGLIDAERYMRLSDVPNPRKANGYGQPRPYDRKEIQQLWAKIADRFPWVDERWFRRWRNGSSRYKRVGNHFSRAQLEAQVSLALFCGLRRQEIFNISLEDLHPDNAYIVVRKGKGDKYREVPYPDAARRRVAKWLDLRDQLNLTHDSPWVVVSINQAHVKRFQPYTFGSFANCLEPVGVEWHRLRHTCATEWLRAGMRIEKLQVLMGHEDIRMTLRYAKIVGADVVESAERHMRNFERALEPKEEE